MRVIKALFMTVLFAASFMTGLLSSQFKAVDNSQSVQKLYNSMNDCPVLKDLTVKKVAPVVINVQKADKKAMKKFNCGCQEGCGQFDLNLGKSRDTSRKILPNP